jgi:diguanylate cyclase (GGDEF)-like protein
MAGMKSVFDKRDDIELFVSYMDTKRCSSTEYFKQLRDLYARKYKFVTFDAIVSSDDHALDFLLEFRDELFPNVPVIFSGINIFSQERLRGKEKFTGIYESYDVPGTIDLMLRLHPKTTSITTVSDDTLSGHNFKQLVADAEPNFSHTVKFNYLDNLSQKDLQQSLSKVPENSLVIWAIYLRTPSSKTLSCEESVKLVSQSSRFATYCIWDVVGQGVVGGKITSPNYQGEAAAEIALRILQGVPIDDIPVIGSPLVNIFDYNVMKKFNITADEIPEPKIFLNKPKTFYGQYKRSIWIVSAIILLVIATITFLVANILLKRQRDQYEHLAMRDQLTGLYNRHYLQEIASYKLSEAIRHQRPMCLLMLDLDLFKAINDTHGHPFGDEVLQRFAVLLNEQSRLEDVVARIDGEEFVILIDQCTAAQANKKAELIRLSVAALKPNGIPITVSIGISELDLNGETFNEFLSRADIAVYQAKNNGRNCVALYNNL